MTTPSTKTAVRAALLIAALAAGGPASAGSGAVDGGRADRAATTDRLIVKYRGASVQVRMSGGTASLGVALAPAELDARIGQAERAAARHGVGLRLLRQTGVGAHVMRLDRAVPLAAAQRVADQLKAEDPSVEFAEPDRRVFPMLTPNDSLYANQWDLYDQTGGIRAPAAWDLATGAGVVVAVIDTGIRPHADLSGQTVAGYDMIADTAVAADGDGRESDPTDPGDWTAANECGAGDPGGNSSWHGTHVAGTIAAKTGNGAGVAGIAFGAKVQPIRVLGKCGGYTSDIADAIVWAAGGSVPGVPANPTPARVLNLSLGGPGACDATTQAAVNSAVARNAVVVVAAGNSAANAANYTPASCSGVVAVAATTRTGARAYYSNFGAVVALAAPGGDMRSVAANGILSTLNDGATAPGADAYAYYQGTSMASPHVAGVAALMIGAKPGATGTEVVNALKSSARAFPGTCSQCGTGIVDAEAAVRAITGTGGGGGGTVVEAESNNTRGTANTISAPATVSGTLSSTTDTDYFRVTLQAGQTLSASLNPGARDYDLYLYNANGTQLASSIKGAGQVDSITYLNTTAQTVFLRVRHYSGGAGSYSLAVSW